ncbi:M48 family metallopeptidase [Owenweeksia hongkongensis]|nr:M48 family metallopeptidase [Owenweeksia hongkongensis]
MKPLISLCIALMPCLAFSQASVYANVDVLRTHIYNGIDDDLKQGKWERRTYRFADLSAKEISKLMHSGRVYTDWAQWELYLNAIFQRIVPPQLANDSLLHAYILADGSFNAFMTPSGSMFINVGVLAQIDDEATLASIMAHELAHYYLKHSLERFIKSESGDFRTLFYDFGANERFSIQNENEADSLATIWLEQSGYALDGMRKSQEISLQLENQLISRLKDKWELKETSHPGASKRLERFNTYAQKTQVDSIGKPFLVSKMLFGRLKKQCKGEVLKNLLATYKYDDCIEKAFKYHLYDPNNPEYVYYIVEAIRKMCYLDPTKWKENFITYRYYNSSEVGNFKVKKLMEENIFTEFRPDLLLITEDEENTIPTMFYWEDSPKFITNEQAFLFYYQVGLALGNNEVILSNALSVTHDKDARNELLRNYLSKSPIDYPEYADALLNGYIWNDLRSRTLTVMNDFDVVIKQGDEKISIPATLEDSLFIRSKVRNILGPFEDKKLLFMQDIRAKSIDEYRFLSEMEIFSLIRLISNSNKTELHILEPGYWSIFMKYGVNEIEFLNVGYFESRSSEKTKEAYEEVLKMSFEEVFDQEKRVRDLQVLVGSVREKEGCLMKFPYVRSYSLPSKNDVHKDFIEYLQAHFYNKEKMEKKADGIYKSYYN